MASIVSGSNLSVAPVDGTVVVTSGDVKVCQNVATAGPSVIHFSPDAFHFKPRRQSYGLPYIFQAINTASANAQHGSCPFNVAESLSTYYLKLTVHGQFNTATLRLDIQDAKTGESIGGSFPYDLDTYSPGETAKTATITDIALEAGRKYQLVLSTNGRNAANAIDYQLYIYPGGIILGENVNGFTAGVVQV